MSQAIHSPRTAGHISSRLRLAIIALVLACMSLSRANAASSTDERPNDTITTSIKINFPINSAVIDRKHASNAAALDSLHSFMQPTADPSSGLTLRSITVNGTSSPDGNLKSNIILARKRMDAMHRYLTSCHGIPDSVIVLGEPTIPWEKFREHVATYGNPRLNAIARSGSDDNAVDVRRRMNRLKKYNNGKLWKQLSTDIFPSLRGAVTLAVVIKATPPRPPEPLEQVQLPADTVAEPETVFQHVDTVSVSAPPAPHPRRQWHIATSIPGWAMAIGNITGEYDLSSHWSVAASLYYSAWNYGKSTRKFRTFILRPEARYWLNDTHNGLFLEAHVQMASYNVALPSWEYRIQDRRGKHPALGGGVGAGYRIPLGNTGHWAVEGAIGAGVYHLDYDRFVNRKNGQWVDRRKRTFFGIDNVAISIVYHFNPVSR